MPGSLWDAVFELLPQCSGSATRTNTTNTDVNQVGHTWPRSAIAEPPFFGQYGSSSATATHGLCTCQDLQLFISSTLRFFRPPKHPPSLLIWIAHFATTSARVQTISFFPSAEASPALLSFSLYPFFLQCISSPTFVSSHSSSKHKRKM